MNVRELQAAIGTPADGLFGPASRTALLAAFTNRSAPAVTENEMEAFAARLGCSLKQIRAVAKVESAGGGFDSVGRPKILFERHLFHRLTDGRYSPAIYSQSAHGGYNEDSWSKLSAACGKDPDAAFSAASWGKFQVLGMHWSKLGYASPFSLAHSTVESEANHYLLLVRYVAVFGLTDAIRRLSTDPETCRDFAHGYNGPGYRAFKYHVKLAEAMK